MAKLSKEEKRKRKLIKILKKPNSPLSFIIFFILSFIFLGLTVASAFLFTAGVGQMYAQMNEGSWETIFLIYPFIILAGIGVVVTGALLVIFIAFLVVAIVRLSIFLKRRKLKLEYAVEDIESIDLSEFK